MAHNSFQPKINRRNVRMLNNQKPKNTKNTLKRLWKLLAGQRVKLISATAFVAMATISNLLGTRLVGIAIDEFISVNNFNGLFKLLVFSAVIYILAAILNRIQILLSVKISQTVVTNLRQMLFEKFQTLPLKFFDTNAH